MLRVLATPLLLSLLHGYLAMFLNLWIMLFFVLTPFFALTIFLSLTEDYEEAQRRKLAFSVSIAVALIGLLLFFAGSQIFAVFGITLDSFRIGAGILLLLSAISLVQGKKTAMMGPAEGDIAVVPLAIPIIVGPATTGTILVMGAELGTIYTKAIGSLALLAAVVCVGLILYAASFIQRVAGTRGIAILSRLTGLILSAMAAQMIMTGIQSFLVVSVVQ
jgi:multiple antibiotic resistance protein